jgi:hypothetical protein
MALTGMKQTGMKQTATTLTATKPIATQLTGFNPSVLSPSATEPMPPATLAARPIGSLNRATRSRRRAAAGSLPVYPAMTPGMRSRAKL